MGKDNRSRFKKTQHKDRRVGGADAVKARNEEAWLKEDEKKSGDEGSSSEEEEEKEQDPKVYRKEKNVSSLAAALGQMHVGAGDADNAEEQLGPTRREREAMEKAAKKARWEKMHAEGKTEEAQADLARLTKIRAEREAAKKAREEAEGAKVEKEKFDSRRNEYVSALGGGAVVENRTKAKKEKKEKKDKSGETEAAAAPPAERKGVQRNNEGLYEGYTSGVAKPDALAKEDIVVGSIEACREAEDDFM